MVYLTLLIGLILLVVGGDLLVRGASKMALAFGMAPLVIGLTVVAFGTSAPELAVSLKAAHEGSANLALGNVVGSNIFNVLFILGISALITPLTVSAGMVRREVPIMIVASLAVLGMGIDGNISRTEGFFLAAGLIFFVVYTLRSAQSQKSETLLVTEHKIAQGSEYPLAQETSVLTADQNIQAERAKEKKKLPLHIGTVILGLVVLVYGSDLLVESAITLARGWGVSELVIGLTIVAAGTSLPEVAASIIAAIRGERDIAVGNVIGSNIFNIFCVLGLSSIFAPQGIDVALGAISFDIPVMIAVAVACLPIFYTGFTIARWEGGFFLLYYIAYTVYLILDAQNHPSSQAINEGLRYFALPLTAITLAVLTYREMRSKKSQMIGGR